MQHKLSDTRRQGALRRWRQWLATGTLATALMACQTNKQQDDPYGDAWGDPFGGGYDPYPSNPGTSGPGGYPDIPQTPTLPQTPYTPPPQPSYTPPPSPPPATTRSHTVARGDTLWNISQRYGTSVNAIKSANGLTSDLIRIGQTLRIP